MDVGDRGASCVSSGAIAISKFSRASAVEKVSSKMWQSNRRFYFSMHLTVVWLLITRVVMLQMEVELRRIWLLWMELSG